MKHIYAAAVISLIATPLWAQSEWTVGLTRGLETYTLTLGDGTVTLICDPDRIFGDGVTNAGLRVIFPNDPDPSRFVVLSATGVQAPFDVSDGGANEASSDADVWKEMTDILRSGGSFAFVTGQDALQFENIAPLPELNC